MAKKVEIDVDRSDINKADLKVGKGNRQAKNNNRRGRRSSSKGNQRSKRDDDRFPKDKEHNQRGSLDNDYKWYTHYQKLFDSVTGVNYGYPTGGSITINSNFPIPQGYSDSAGGNIIPGILTTKFIPTVGDMSAGVNSPINKVCNQLYAVMRRELGSTAKYDAPDIGQYLIAMDSAYILYAFAVKIYGCLNRPNPFNYYYGRALIESMDVDYDSFYQNMSQFRSALNAYANYMSARLVPGDFDYFARHLWLIQNIFTDADSAKAQMYQYVPYGIYVYTEQVDGPAINKFTPIIGAGQTKFTYQRFQQLVQDIQASLMFSEDIGQMSADIGKAFGASLFGLQLIPEDYVTPIGYSAEVLSQVENSTMWAAPYTNETMNISPDIIQETQLDGSGPRLSQALFTSFDTSSANTERLLSEAYEAGKNPMLNFHSPEVTKEMTMVATRGTVVPKTSQIVPGTSTLPNTLILQIGPCGSELYINSKMYKLTPNGQYTTFSFTTVRRSLLANSIEGVLPILAAWSVFDWAPHMRWILQDETAKVLTVNRFQDIDVAAVIDYTQLAAMHETALLSLFYSPKFMGEGNIK